MKAKNTLLLISLIVVGISAGLYIGSQNGRVDDRLSSGVARSKPESTDVVQASRTPSAAAPAQGERLVFESDVAWGKPQIPPAESSTATADIQILATAFLPRARVLPAGQPKVGDVLRFPVGDLVLRGKVEAVFPDDGGHFMASGRFEGEAKGEFSLSQEIKSKTWTGKLLDRDHKVAYTIRTVGDAVRLDKRPLSAVICAMPRSPDWKPQPEAIAAVPAAPVVPALDSKPAATAVIYLDFDGEIVTDAAWRGGLTIVAASALVGYPGTGITTAQIQDVWQRVVEDFRLFDVSITTIRSRYDSASDGNRARAIITPTQSWYSDTAGGVAMLKSFRGTSESYSSTIPCWVFNRGTTQEIAMTVSHEVGHMLNLSHDGTNLQGPDSYYGGHDSGVRSWGPLMGAPFGKSLTQWSKGEYPDANNTEDDLVVIAQTLVAAGATTGLVADDVGDTTGTAKALSILPTISDGGIITSAGDVDMFSFKSNGGGITVTVNPQAVDGDLDADVSILDNTGSPVSGMGVTLLTNLPAIKLIGSLPGAGTYYIAVRGRGQAAAAGPPAVTGYSTYGSLGIYTITGTYVPTPEVPVITTEPADATANQGATVALSVKAISNSTLTYQWFQKISGQPDKLLTGKTTATLTLAAIQPASAGVYYVRCHNASGDTFSRDVTVVVRYKPVITQQPLPAKQVSLAVGTMVSYQIIANGTAPITYQWKKNNVVMPGETNDTLNLGAVDWFDAATYVCVLTNPLGSVTSAAASFTVASPPVFTAPVAFVPPVIDPSYKYIPLGGTASFAATAVGTAPITYEWYQNGSKIASGVNKTTFAWSAIKATANGTYYVRAFNAVGSTTSPNFIVEVQDKPVISAQPVATLTAQADQNVTISCGATGTDTMATPMRFQWQLNSVNISDGSGYAGTQTNTLTINPVHWRHRGTYRCIVTNAVGTATTRNCVFTVVSYPVILTQPVTPKKIVKNGTATLSVVAGGTGTLKYQWYRKVSGLPDQLLVGKTTASLVLSKVTAPATDGSYYCIVTLLAPSPMPGTATSNDSVVTVEDPPVPGLVTSSLGRFSVGLNEAVTLSVNATGSPTLRYQWQKNNVDIAGQINASLSFAAPQFTDAGSYRVKVTNDVGVVYSAAVALKVVNKPGIIQQPANLSLYEYDNASFTVSASGSPPFTYQWYYNGAAITTNTTAKTATLAINGIRIITTTGGSNAGNYHCVVTNSAGTVTSNDASLIITPVPAPTLTDVRPTHVANGDSILVTGTNLNWLTTAKLGSTVLSFVKNSPTEVFVKLPSGLLISTPSGVLTLTTYGGPVSYPTQITVHKDGLECDNFLNAKFLALSGTQYQGKGINTSAGVEPGEPDLWVGHTLWFRWRAPASGRLTIRTTGSTVENQDVFYRGPRLPTDFTGLTLVGYFYNYYGYYLNDPGVWYFNVTAGQDYYFKMDSGFSAIFGSLGLAVSLQASAPRSLYTAAFEAVQGYREGGLSGQDEWQVSGGRADLVESTPGDHSVRLGLHAGGGSAVAWHATGDSDDSNVEGISVSADLSVNTTIGTAETFSWGLFDSSGAPALAVTFDAASGTIETQPAGTKVLSQKLIPGIRRPVSLTCNKAEGSWGISMDGVLIASGDHWQAPAGGLVNVGASWKPAAGSHTGGTIEFDNVVVTAVDPPSSHSEEQAAR